MTIFRYSALTMLIAGYANAQEFSVPSGLNVALFDVIVEPDPAVARFRFLVPEIADGRATYEDIADDFQHLCDTMAQPALAENGWTKGDVVISYSSSEVPFGETAPEVTQFFQPFSLQGDTCQWEDF